MAYAVIAEKYVENSAHNDDTRILLIIPDKIGWEPVTRFVQLFQKLPPGTAENPD